MHAGEYMNKEQMSKAAIQRVDAPRRMATAAHVALAVCSQDRAISLGPNLGSASLHQFHTAASKAFSMATDNSKIEHGQIDFCTLGMFIIGTCSVHDVVLVDD